MPSGGPGACAADPASGGQGRRTDARSRRAASANNVRRAARLLAHYSQTRPSTTVWVAPPTHTVVEGRVWL